MRRTPHVLAAVVAAAAAGCIEADPGPTPPEPMCHADSDCDAPAGEICDDGICWGNPPDGVTFAAVLNPPEGRPDLAPSEVPAVVFEDDGTALGLVFAETVTLSGRVVLAGDPDRSVAAQIRVERPSRIPGGPAYLRTAVAAPGRVAGELAFALRVPRLSPNDPPYVVDVVPDDGSLAEPGPDGPPATVAPPLRFRIDGTRDLAGVDIAVGDPSALKGAAGRVVDAAGRGVPGLRVVARGRWSEDAPLERVSSVATTDTDGAFVLWIPIGMADWNYELVVQPPAGAVAPTLRVRGVRIPDPVDGAFAELPPLSMPSFPSGARYAIDVIGRRPEGGVTPVEGALVEATAILVDPVVPVGETGEVDAVYTARGVTDAAGRVELDLIPGGTANRVYLLSIQPLPTSEFAAAHDVSVAVGPPGATGANVLPAVELARRVAVSGVVVAADGTPAAGTTITARATAAFKWSLEPALQAKLDDFRYPAATADESGRFVLWVDAEVFGAAPVYDLDLVPGAGARAPRWTVRGIDLAAAAPGAGLDLGDVALPPASFARGAVLTGDGEAIAGAEVQLYEIAADDAACDSAFAPVDATGACHAPAALRSVSQTDDAGTAVFVLPRPR